MKTRPNTFPRPGDRVELLMRLPRGAAVPSWPAMPTGTVAQVVQVSGLARSGRPLKGSTVRLLLRAPGFERDYWADVEDVAPRQANPRYYGRGMPEVRQALRERAAPARKRRQTCPDCRLARGVCPTCSISLDEWRSDVISDRAGDLVAGGLSEDAALQQAIREQEREEYRAELDHLRSERARYRFRGASLPPRGRRRNPDVTNVLGESRPAKDWAPDGYGDKHENVCPWCQSVSLGQDLKCNNPACSASRWADPERERAAREAYARRAEEDRQRQAALEFSRKFDADRRAEAGAHQAALLAECDSRGACRRCLVASPGWVNEYSQAKFVRHRGACPKERR